MEKLVHQASHILSRIARATWWSKDWLIKLLSLGLGIFLWFFVAGTDHIDSTITMPIELVNLPANMIIANPAFKQEIEVSLRGPRSLVQAARDRQLTRRVDLSKAEPGPFTIQNSGDTINLPRGLSLVRLQPTNIVLQLDRLSQKQVPIHPVTEGVLAPGRALRHIVLSPDSIRVTGPKTLLDNIAALQTRAIDINGMRDNGTRQVAVQIPADLLDLIGETVVNASIEVGLHMQQLRLEHLKLDTVPPEAAARLQTPSVTVDALIPVSLLQGRNKPAQYFRPVVLVPEQSNGTSLPVTVQTIGTEAEVREIKILEIIPPLAQIEPLPPPAQTAEDPPGKKSTSSNKDKKSVN